MYAFCLFLIFAYLFDFYFDLFDSLWFNLFDIIFVSECVLICFFFDSFQNMIHSRELPQLGGSRPATLATVNLLVYVDFHMLYMSIHIHIYIYIYVYTMYMAMCHLARAQEN